MNQSFKILWLVLILFFIGSCSPKPEPEPKPVAKVKSKKPAWTDGKIKSSGEWYGISSGKIGDTLDLEKAAKDLINEQGFSVMPLIEYSYDTINYDLKVPSPSPPSFENLLGTDDQGRDVLARLIYGFRISVFFGLILTILSSIIGIFAGGIQGFYGGKIDLLFRKGIISQCSGVCGRFQILS